MACMPSWPFPWRTPLRPVAPEAPPSRSPRAAPWPPAPRRFPRRCRRRPWRLRVFAVALRNTGGSRRVHAVRGAGNAPQMKDDLIPSGWACSCGRRGRRRGQQDACNCEACVSTATRPASPPPSPSARRSGLRRRAHLPIHSPCAPSRRFRCWQARGELPPSRRRLALLLIFAGRMETGVSPRFRGSGEHPRSHGRARALALGKTNPQTRAGAIPPPRSDPSPLFFPSPRCAAQTLYLRDRIGKRQADSFRGQKTGLPPPAQDGLAAAGGCGCEAEAAAAAAEAEAAAPRRRLPLSEA